MKTNIKEEVNVQTAREQIIKALECLGIEGKDVWLDITEISLNRYKVDLNDMYFGTFDITRNTFVD